MIEEMMVGMGRGKRMYMVVGLGHLLLALLRGTFHLIPSLSASCISLAGLISFALFTYNDL